MLEDARLAAFEESGLYTPPTFEADGFVHLSEDPVGLVETANHFYKASSDNWTVLVLDPSKCGDVRFEAAAAVGSTKPPTRDAKMFPHLYNALPIDAVIGKHAMVRASDGTFISIPGVGAGDVQALLSGTKISEPLAAGAGSKDKHPSSCYQGNGDEVAEEEWD